MEINAHHRLFIGEVVAACAKYGITLYLPASKKVVQPGESTDLGCSGFFLASDKTLAVAMDKPVPEWLAVMLHEFGHMEQWMEEPEQCAKDDLLIDRLWEWLDSKRELDSAEVRKLTELALSYELDCERRTAWRLHEEPEFGLNYKDYIRRANTYLYLYPLIAKHRKWCGQCPPYHVSELIAIMPDKFEENYWNVPEEVERLMVDRCFPKETL